MDHSGGQPIFDAIADLRQNLATLDRDIDDAARIDLLTELEELKSCCAAAQAKTTADLDESRRRERAQRGVPADQQGRGIGMEVALARRDSTHKGSRHLGMARALVHEMPHTLRLLERGLLSEWRATILVCETACLTREDRMAIDAELCADPGTVEGLGDRRLRAKARELAARYDAEAMVKRARKAEGDRCVTTRAAPDTMAYLTALLPVKQAVCIYATLDRDAKAIRAAGDNRGHGQIMADLLTERVTGIASANAVPVSVNLIVSDEVLFADGTEPGYVPGYGPIPAGLARHWAKDAAADSRAELRKVYATPKTGTLTAMESKSRCFPTALARLIDTRDRVCRTPWCDAPIRHRDHITAYESGGATTADNGAGLCEACNYAEQGEGFDAKPEPTPPGEPHVYTLTTPTGHQYRSVAPPLPRPLEQINIVGVVERHLAGLFYDITYEDAA
ncbi:DUF222 domain-containing protein [Skermania sp. ID1734]|uniref:HNH endonuclease n=1 Tax=Skermania sp. ID1734 TaxID=2597516 RepID=UPI0011810978|nr:DUF222 domain-containing protein [Skermania sp. ID1734]TSD95685.1 DUF222 domain-containing protein [Skermania sp. ID1734]